MDVHVICKGDHSIEQMKHRVKHCANTSLHNRHTFQYSLSCGSHSVLSPCALCTTKVLVAQAMPIQNHPPVRSFVFGFPLIK